MAEDDHAAGIVKSTEISTTSCSTSTNVVLHAVTAT